MIRTYTGHMVDPLNLKESDIFFPDIAHSLALLNRFTGHTWRPYSVGEHTIKLVLNVPAQLQRAAFLHDFSEAYFQDVPRPLKRLLPEYCAAEERAQRVIFKRFNEPWENMKAIEPYDTAICGDELWNLFDPPYASAIEPLGLPPECFDDEPSWSFIESQFYAIAESLNVHV